jgi:glycosyltransferase involved in cell wall biosynthesis
VKRTADLAVDDRPRTSLDRAAARSLEIGIVADLLEEGWPSMDLVADMLLAELQQASNPLPVKANLLRPSLPRRSERLLSRLTARGSDIYWDRFINRFWDYPRWLRARSNAFDVFHVVDHSYAHVVHELPASRTVVTCHDVDAFLRLVDPGLTASRLPVALARRILSGMQKAARVACDSLATRDELCRYGLVPEDRLVVVYNGVHPSCSPKPDSAADRWAAATIGDAPGARIDLLHVGSTVARKRIDILLRVFAAIRACEPRVRLLKAGGVLTAEQRALLQTLGLEHDFVALPHMTPSQLAAMYRRASLLLLPSEREGFGLPVVEAMACGTAVVASDLPVLREIGGTAAVYRALGDVAGWRDAALDLLDQQKGVEEWAARQAARLARATRYSWTRHAASMAAIYSEVSAENPRDQR